MFACVVSCKYSPLKANGHDGKNNNCLLHVNFSQNLSKMNNDDVKNTEVSDLKISLFILAQKLFTLFDYVD